MSKNEKDEEPVHHSSGFTLTQRTPEGIRSNNREDPTLNFWEDGNGSGTEKYDAYSHIGWHTKTPLDFYRKSWQPFIKSYNHNDKEPVSHPNGFQNLGQKKWYWNYINQGATEKEFYDRARKPELGVDHAHDQEPVEHSNGFS